MQDSNQGICNQIKMCITRNDKWPAVWFSIIVNWTLGDKLQWKFNQNLYIFINKMHLITSFGKWWPFCLSLRLSYACPVYKSYLFASLKSILVRPLQSLTNYFLWQRSSPSNYPWHCLLHDDLGRITEGPVWHLSVILYKNTYRQISNTRRNKSPNLNVSHLVLQLLLPNPFKPGAN